MHWWLNCQERLRSRKNRDRHTKQRIDRITRATTWGILWSWSDAMRRRMTNLVNKEQWDSWMKVWVSYFWHHVIGRQQSRLLLKFITQSNIVESHGRSTIKQRIMGETHYIKAWWETKGWFSSEWFVEKKHETKAQWKDLTSGNCSQGKVTEPCLCKAASDELMCW